MTEELSGVTVVIIIGGGVLTFIILFIFAKRQIMRFALRSRRGPHVPIGHDAKKKLEKSKVVWRGRRRGEKNTKIKNSPRPVSYFSIDKFILSGKSLKREIERRIEVIPRIVHEPKLISEENSRYILTPGSQVPVHYYRFRAVDDMKNLEEEINRQSGGMRRHPCESIRAFLLSALMNCQGQKLVQQLCDMYEHARHDPSEFGDDEYQAYNRLLLKLCDAARMLKSFNSSAKTSPNKKQASVRSLLEPSRLKPPSSLGVTLSSNKLAVTTLHNQYTTLQNVTLDPKVEDEIVSVPVKTPTKVSIPGQKTDNETTV